VAAMVSDPARVVVSRATRRRSANAHVWKRWTLAWLGGSALGVVNGTARELLYKERVGELTAHQLSTVSGIALFALYFALLERAWPIPTERTALTIGGTWLGLTVAFEFGFGHYVDGKSWAELLHDHNLADGRVWTLMLTWIALGPAAVRLIRSR
jgi:hypothetical protein